MLAFMRSHPKDRHDIPTAEKVKELMDRRIWGEEGRQMVDVAIYRVLLAQLDELRRIGDLLERSQPPGEAQP